LKKKREIMYSASAVLAVGRNCAECRYLRLAINKIDHVRITTLERVRVTIVSVEKAVRITYSKGVSVALVIQHAKRMPPPYYRLSLVRLYHIFPHCLINGVIFWKKKVIEPEMCALIFSTACV
jgi:hypothetical protein